MAKHPVKKVGLASTSERNVRHRIGFLEKSCNCLVLLRVRSEVIRRKMRVTSVWKEREIIC
jgi:DNA-binding winged helix-turn-helix (wHTH) protein